MIYRKLSSNGEYIFPSIMVSGVEAVGQAIITRLKLLKQEWWENLEEGTPLWQQILGSPMNNNQKTSIDNIIIKRIEGTSGVTSISTYESSFDPQTRVYSFYAQVDTKYGSLTVEESL